MIRKNPAVDLRAHYRKTMEAGLAIALTLVIAAFKFFPAIEPPPALASLPQEPIISEPSPVTSQPVIPPPPLRPPVVIEAPDAPPLGDLPVTTDLITDQPVPPPTHETPEDFYFEVVEESPQPIGGYAEIARNLRYPELARRAGIEGTVVVLAYIDESGKVTRTEIKQGLGLGFDEAAAAAIEKTTFRPGRQRGKAVKVRIEIPLQFRLH